MRVEPGVRYKGLIKPEMGISSDYSVNHAAMCIIAAELESMPRDEQVPVISHPNLRGWLVCPRERGSSPSNPSWSSESPASCCCVCS